MSTYIWKLEVLTQNLFQAFSSHAQTLRHICYVESYIHVIYMYIVLYKNANKHHKLHRLCIEHNYSCHILGTIKPYSFC